MPLPPDESGAGTVDAACGREKPAAGAGGVAFLFDLCRRYTSLLPAAPAIRRGKRGT